MSQSQGRFAVKMKKSPDKKSLIVAAEDLENGGEQQAATASVATSNGFYGSVQKAFKRSKSGKIIFTSKLGSLWLLIDRVLMPFLYVFCAAINKRKTRRAEMLEFL